MQTKVFGHQHVVNLVSLSIPLKKTMDVVSIDVLHPYRLTALFKLMSRYKICLIWVLSVQSLVNCLPFIRNLCSYLLTHRWSLKQRDCWTTLGVCSAPKNIRSLCSLVGGFYLLVRVLKTCNRVLPIWAFWLN